MLYRWIPLTKTSDAELWCFLWSAPEQTVEQTTGMPVIWDTLAPIMTSLQWPNIAMELVCFISVAGLTMFRPEYAAVLLSLTLCQATLNSLLYPIHDGTDRLHVVTTPTLRDVLSKIGTGNVILFVSGGPPEVHRSTENMLQVRGMHFHSDVKQISLLHNRGRFLTQGYRCDLWTDVGPLKLRSVHIS